jgi:SAM-dependent methyltransferase
LDNYRDSVRPNLILAYDRAAEERDGYEVAGWKIEERERFLKMLRAEEKIRLVDIGSGPGTHAVYFQENGIAVTCIDLSPRNVSICKQKGLAVFECDVLDLPSLREEFEAAFAMNSLLHIPRQELPGALAAIHRVLTPGGLFFWGQFGGEQSEGVYQEDLYEPKRFYSLLEDGQIVDVAAQLFKLERFASIAVENENKLHFQSLILRAENGRTDPQH